MSGGAAIRLFGTRRRGGGVAEAVRRVSRSDAYADLPAATPEEVAAYARATTGYEDEGAEEAAKVHGAGPIRLVVSWVDTLDRKEAVETAKAWAEAHFSATQISSFHVERNPGTGNGWFYEVHEGGHGRAYLPNAIKALVATRKPVWIKVRNRAFTIQVSDGRPCCVLEASENSKSWFARTAMEIGPSRTRMQPIVWKGGHVLTAGVFTAISGMAFLGVAVLASTRSVNALPAPPTLDASSIPSKLAQRFDAVPLTKYISVIRFKDGRWQAPVIKAVEKYAGRPERPGDRPRPTDAALPPPPTGRPAPASGPPTTSMPGLNDILSPSNRPKGRPAPIPGTAPGPRAGARAPAPAGPPAGDPSTAGLPGMPGLGF